MASHEKAFAEIKNYYNDITHNNLDLIKSLKEEVADVRRREIQDEKAMETVACEGNQTSTFWGLSWSENCSLHGRGFR